MKIPGLLIEYLFTGSLVFLACLLIVPADYCSELLPTQISDKALGPLLITPVIYLAGAMLDSFGSLILRIPKKRIRENARKEWSNILPDNYKLPDESKSRMLAVYLLLTNETIGKEFESRSSRDRIARGAFFVSLLSIIPSLYWDKIIAAIVLVVLSIALFALWWKEERSSYLFKLRAWYLSSEEELIKNGPNN